MIPLLIEITEYDKYSNTCKAKLQNGNIVDFDPFVSCAITMRDDQYEAGKGFDIVGNKYLMTTYTVYKDNVVPHENGLIQQ